VIVRYFPGWVVTWPSDFLVNHWKPRELGVASANRHSWLGSHVVLARPWFCGSTKKPIMTSSCCSSHHAVRTWLRWPLGPSNEAYLSSPHPEASPATTFRTCSSPAPTPVKPQPAPAILGQELVHTTLSIIHYTRKRPSPVLEQQWSSISPLMSALTTHTYSNLREKKKKRNE
jgi:hypothetical protein